MQIAFGKIGGTMVKPRSSGFTMIELMVVLAIMAIITVVAFPSYQQSMRKTRRADAVSAALAVQVAQERFRANCPLYAQNLGTANNCATSTADAPSESEQGFYDLTIAATPTGNAYTIVATAKGAQAADTGCTTMQIAFSGGSANGTRTPAICWP